MSGWLDIQQRRGERRTRVSLCRNNGLFGCSSAIAADVSRQSAFDCWPPANVTATIRSRTFAT
jgi:hypothetical protein